MRLSPLNLSIAAAVRLKPKAAPAPAPTPGAIIASIQADGASVIPIAPAAVYYPDDPAKRETFAVNDPGFDSSGNATTFTRNIVLTMRRPNGPFKFGNQTDAGTLETDTFGGTPTGVTAISDWLFSTTSLAGAINNSTVSAPKPIAACLTPSGQAVYSDGFGLYKLAMEWVAFTYAMDLTDGQTAPCLQYRVTDSSGAPGAWMNATWYDELPSGYGRNCVCGFAAPVDVTAAAAGSGYVDWRVFPQLGTAAAIRSTTDSVKPRAVGRINFTKITSAMPIIYVGGPNGNDTTGDGSFGNPYLTGGKAVQALGTGRSGGEVRALGDFAWGTQPTTQIANTAHCTIRKDPTVTGSVTMSLPAGNTSLQTAMVRFKDVTVLRAGGYYMSALANGTVWFDNAIMDFGSASNSIPLSQTAVTYQFTGGALLNYLNSSYLQGGPNISIGFMYGLACIGAVSAGLGLDLYVAIGCSFRGVRHNTNSSPQDYQGAIIAFNSFMGTGSVSSDTLNYFPLSGSTVFDGLCIFYNEFEWTSSQAQNAIGLSRDPPSNNFSITNLIYAGNANGGVSNAARENFLYDNNTDSFVRNHGVVFVVGNICGQRNMKGGQEAGVDGLAAASIAALHIGNMPHLCGTGFRDNVILNLDAANGKADGNYVNRFSQLFPGLNTHVGTGTATRDDVYANWLGVTRTGTTYATRGGGSDMRVKDTAAPQYGRLARALTRRTLGGNVRPTPASAGPRELVA